MHGHLHQRPDLQKHIDAGARGKVDSCRLRQRARERCRLSFMASNSADGEPIISTASCTTNCIAPVIEVMGRRIGIAKGADDDGPRLTPPRRNWSTGRAGKWRRGDARPRPISCRPRRGRPRPRPRPCPSTRARFDGVAIPRPGAGRFDLQTSPSLRNARPAWTRSMQIFEEEAGRDRLPVMSWA